MKIDRQTLIFAGRLKLRVIRLVPALAILLALFSMWLLAGCSLFFRTDQASLPATGSTATLENSKETVAPTRAALGQAPATSPPASQGAQGAGTPAAPAPAAGENRQVTGAENGQTVKLHVGERFLLNLGDSYDWSVQIADPGILSRVIGVLTIRGSQGLFQARQAGQTTLTATGTTPPGNGQATITPGTVTFQVKIDVQPGQAAPETTQVASETPQATVGTPLALATAAPALATATSLPPTSAPSGQRLPLVSGRRPVSFQPGASFDVITMRLAPNQGRAFSLEAQAGQTLFLMTNSGANLQVYDSRKQPLTDVFNGPGPFSASLPYSGVYYIALQGNGKTTISIFIPALNTTPQAPAPVPGSIQPIIFPPGANSIKFSTEMVDGIAQGYRLQGQAGQTVTLTAAGDATLALLDAQNKALPASSPKPGQWVFKLPANGDYTLVLLGQGHVDATAGIQGP